MTTKVRSPEALARRQATSRERTKRIREQQRNGEFTPEQVLAFSKYLGEQDPETGCITWTGAYNKRSALAESNRPVFQTMNAYKAAWLIAQLLLKGHPVPWPTDERGRSLDAAHLCRTWWCVNYQDVQPMTPEEHAAYDGIGNSHVALSADDLERLLTLPDPF